MYTYTAFDNFKVISHGKLQEVSIEVKKFIKQNKDAQVLIFSDHTGRQIDLDLSGTEKDVLEKLKIYTHKPTPVHLGAGRPKLGVVAREISLLPHHWEWLLNQESGSSGTIRKLIDEKINSSTQTKDKIKKAQEVTYKFLSAIAGNLPNFEEATRFLYRKDKNKFEELISDWPKDISRYTKNLAKDVFY